MAGFYLNQNTLATASLTAYYSRGRHPTQDSTSAGIAGTLL